MVDTNSLWLYVMTCLVINLSPGPSILYVTTVASSRGIGPAMFSIAGMSIGILIHVLATATGLAAVVLASSAAVYTALKFAGAAYLVYLGLRTWLTPPSANTVRVSNETSPRESFFVRGILVDLLNPKIALFFLALFPQFIDSASGSTFLSTLFLGSVFVVIGGCVNASIAIVVARGAQVVRSSAKPWVERWIPGAVLLGLGGKLAVDEL